MKTIYPLIAAGITAGVILNSCQSSSEKAQENVTEARKDLTQAQQEYEEAIEKFREETAAKISDNEHSISEIKTKIANEKKDAQEVYNAKINDLELKNRELQKRLDDYHPDRKDQWDSFKREFNHDLDELGTSLKDFTIDNTK
jgi:septal ring factor EnvC (AmiA/AmiB activator)